MIRPATMRDLPDLLAFCLECEGTMHWRAHGLRGDSGSVLSTLTSLIREDCAHLAVVDLDGTVSGACAAALQGFAWNKRITVASELIWHMRPSFPDGPAKTRWLLRMLTHLRAWAATAGSDVFKVNTVHMDTALGQALERRGFSPFETVYLAEVSRGS